MLPTETESASRIQTVCLMVLASAATMFSIYWLRPVLVPLVVAFMVVSGISPLLSTLEQRLGVSRIIAAAIAFLAGVVLLLVFGLSIWNSVIELKDNSAVYRDRVEDIVNWAEERADFVKSLIGDATSVSASSNDSGAATVQVADDSGQDPSAFIDALVRDGIAMVSQAFISLVSTSVVVLIYVFFLLIGTSQGTDLSETLREVNHQVRTYLALKTVISILTGFAFGLALHLFGVPMAFTFGVLAFFLNFVPNIGPLVASVLPIPLILLDPDGSLAWMLTTIVVICTIQGISGNVLEPKWMGNSSDLHPVTILVALMFWGMMWGLVGMFLATPVTAALKIMLARITQTRPVAELMAGRFVKTDPPSA
ncbi:MAG: AI-2E family transporter [Planctomycetota bacterium]